MPVALENPYAKPGTPWLRGNLHAHTTNSDGKAAPQAVVDLYAERGYDFLMISDHDKLTDPKPLDARGMVLIPGNEVSARGPHLLHVDAHSVVPPDEDRQTVLHHVLADGGFAVLNHPNWQKSFNHCSLELLEKLEGYAGIEIYNGVIRRLEGSPLATDKWDRLLASGRRLWGFANDDSHAPEQDIALAWNVVQADDRSVKGIVDAFLDGRFYASTGVEIESVSVEGATVKVTAPNAKRLVVNGDWGKRLKQADATEIAYSVEENAPYTYIRVEAYGEGEAQAWTQPFFIRK